MHLFFSTYDGHTQLIAGRVALRLAKHGIKTNPRDLKNDFPSWDDMRDGAPVALIAALRYGYHLPEAERFMREVKAQKLEQPMAIASVNLVARKAHKNTAQTNPYLRRWLQRHKIEPALATAFAGKLDYPRYGWFDRNAIRLIMAVTRGPTDPTVTVEFTDWGKVDAFADQLAAL